MLCLRYTPSREETGESAVERISEKMSDLRVCGINQNLLDKRVEYSVLEDSDFHRHIEEYSYQYVVLEWLKIEIKDGIKRNKNRRKSEKIVSGEKSKM